ncbi:putative Lipoprotein [Xenorhabdus bovienii str. Jollieti]|uniref:Putative Lipoprotein n=1 Tax=Xenorhabdus bovienii (strain SS-2004) TaxID=406818 RepID=D3UZY8_XENBS|nr:hypothetical protein [Xenorhabdus bovienii]CBJ80281.1 putative Lipoprotein [Xenorhabdus bovienii SS-2004]CDH29983.1 putative Lipoprotein [Xenorhabdus bovienii str. Jollieti]
MVLQSMRSMISLCMIFLLVACQTPQGPSAQTGKVDSRLTQSQDVEFFNKSGWQACAAGAAAGALACLLINGDHQAICIAAAAIVGCGVGVGANAYLDNQRTKYASKEQLLAASINDVKAENQRIKNVTATVKEVIKTDKLTLAQINKDIAAKVVKKDQVQKQLKGLDANIVYLRNTIKEMKEHENQWQNVSTQIAKDGTKTKDLNNQIVQMRKNIGSLQQELDSLYEQRTAIKVS